MKKAGIHNMGNLVVMAFVVGAAQLFPGCLYAQERLPGRDTASSARSGSAEGLNQPNSFSGLPKIRSGLSNSPAFQNSSKGAGISDYRLKLAKNFSLETGSQLSFLSPANLRYMMNEPGIDGASGLNPNSFRRGFPGLRQLRFDIQNFTLGASYNYGQGNGGRAGGFSGEGLQSGRNVGLSLHAGLHF